MQQLLVRGMVGQRDSWIVKVPLQVFKLDHLTLVQCSNFSLVSLSLELSFNPFPRPYVFFLQACSSGLAMMRESSACLWILSPIGFGWLPKSMLLFSSMSNRMLQDCVLNQLTDPNTEITGKQQLVQSQQRLVSITTLSFFQCPSQWRAHLQVKLKPN